MIASTALFMRHVDHADGTERQVAATDGRTVMFWPRFRTYRTSDRLGIMLHEYMHAAFAHPLRAVRMRRRHGALYRHDVMNVAADAIINQGIRNASGRKVTLPDDGIKLSVLVDQAQAVQALTGVEVDLQRMANLGKLSLEWLYDLLIRLIAAAEAYRENTSQKAEDGNQTGDGSGNGGDGQAAEASRRADGIHRNSEGKVDAFLRTFGGQQDVLTRDLEGLDDGQLQDGILKAAENIRNAIATHKAHGSSKAGVLEQLEGDIPKAGTPWEASFRSITQRHLAKQRVKRPSRPGRRMLTQEAMGLRHVVWSAGRTRPQVPRVVVVLDSSGSVTPHEYLAYLGEIQGMKRRTNAEIYAVVADSEVRSVTRVDDVASIASIPFDGRAGTDFRPGLAVADDLQADLCVYLTDLMGRFPEAAPSCPVLWAVAADGVPDGYQPPFGRVLLMR